MIEPGNLIVIDHQCRQSIDSAHQPAEPPLNSVDPEWISRDLVESFRHTDRPQYGLELVSSVDATGLARGNITTR